MTLRTRLALSLFTIAVVLLVPLAIALHSLQRIHTEAQQLRDREFAASLLLGRLRDGVNDLRAAEQRLALVHDAASRDTMARTTARVSALVDTLERFSLVRSGEVRSAVDQVSATTPQEAQAALAGRLKQADSISERGVQPAFARAEAGIGAAERELRELTRGRVERTATTIAEAEQISAIALLMALLLAAGIAVWLSRSITQPVSALERGMSAVADGDFSHTLHFRSDRPAEFERLATSFDEMTRQLAELDKLKAEFVSVASHELKTPINVVGGYLQLLQEGVYGPLAPKQEEVLRTLQGQIQSLSRLVKRLLDVSRFEAGGGKLEPRHFALGALLDEMEQSFHVLASQRGVRFVVTRGAGLPGEVVWDEDRMTEVLGNLLSNAFKFTDRGGEVELRAEPANEGRDVMLEVHDTGKGIPAEQLPHVFEKFFQASNQTAGSQGGTGLGLAIAKTIVEAHHGSISVESQPGEGTTFRIILPTQAATMRRSHAVRPEPATTTV